MISIFSTLSSPGIPTWHTDIEMFNEHRSCKTHSLLYFSACSMLLNLLSHVALSPCCSLAMPIALVSDRWSPRLGLGQRIAWQGFDLLIKHWGFFSPNWSWAPQLLSWENFEASHDFFSSADQGLGSLCGDVSYRVFLAACVVTPGGQILPPGDAAKLSQDAQSAWIPLKKKWIRSMVSHIYIF